MKKTIAIIVSTLMAFGSHAASFSWGTGSTKVAFDGSTLTSGATVYLVQLSDSGLNDLYTISYDAPGSITPAASVQNTAPMTTGRNVGAVSATYRDNNLANGMKYGAYITYNDGTDTWYNFSSSLYEVSGLVNGTEILSTTFAFDFGTKTEITADGMTPSGWTKINIASPSVPEPATGALALAGVALLFRRRKA